MLSMRLLWLFAIMPLLAGCASYDSGKIDYRKADYISQEAAVDFRKSHRAECWKEPPTVADIANGPGCSYMLPARLSDKNFTSGQSAIAVDDVYSIRLDHGLIAQIPEKRSFFRPGASKNGEIVILVNAFEFAGTTEDAKNARFVDVLEDNHEGSPSLAEARVIYYSSDVEERQDLNFSNIPISGPIKYAGRPMGIQIIVLELDRVSNSTKSLLKSLADMGKTYAAPSHVNEALVTLGKSLLDGNRDDVLFEYRMVLDNAADLNNQITPNFTAGKYVFRRLQERERPAIWNNMRLDQNTGAIFYWADAQTYKEQVYQQGKALLLEEPNATGMIRVPYTLETYFTVSVINHGKNGIVAEYAYDTWAETSKKIDAALENPALAPEQLREIIAVATKNRLSINAMKGINNAVDPVLQKWIAYAHMPKGSADANDYLNFPDYSNSTEATKTACKASWGTLYTTISKSGLLKQQARLETVGLVKAWKGALTVTDGKQLLQPAEDAVALRQFVEKLHHRFGVVPDDAYPAFADRVTFSSTYLGDNPEALGLILEKMADNRKPDMPNTCAGLN